MNIDNHFHSEKNGCKIIKKEFKNSRGDKSIHGKYCLTHKKNLCRCGWEWSWHYGDYSKILTKKSNYFFNSLNLELKKPDLPEYKYN